MPPKKQQNYKIGVIGAINRDSIYHDDDSRVDSYGGILYNLKYLATEDSIRVRPVVNIGYDCFRPIIKILKSLGKLDLSLVKKVNRKNNHCHMHYTDQAHRCEFLSGAVPPLTYSRVKPLLDSDLILVNFITGNDIRLDVLERLRSEFNGLIYIDIHSLTLGRKKVKGGFHRSMRKPLHWKRYAACADILQLNRAEFELIAGKSFSGGNAIEFFENNLRPTQCLNITLGSAGCFFVYRKNKALGRKISAPEVRRVYDTTGCGDVFAAGFISEYLHSRSYSKAAASGNRLAAGRCRLRGPFF